MTITSARLVAGTRELSLTGDDRIADQRLDVPLPEVRDVSEPRVDTDGERDTTALHAGTSASLEVTLLDDPASILDDLSYFLRPDVRPYLYVTDDEWAGERRLRLRADQRSAPVAARDPAHVRQVQAQWRVPDGIWEAAASTTTVVRADISDGLGLQVPVVVTGASGVTLSATTASGVTEIPISGSADLHWVARLYGPAAGPRLTLDNTGASIVFESSLTIPAGDYVEIDSRAQSASYLGTGTLPASRLRDLDFAATDWWRLRAGEINRVRYHPVSETTGATAAHIFYRTAWL